MLALLGRTFYTLDALSGIQAANSVDILKAKHIVHHTTLSLQKQKCSHKDKIT